MEYVLFYLAKCQFKPVVLAQLLTMPPFTQKASWFGYKLCDHPASQFLTYNCHANGTFTFLYYY